MTHKIVVIGDIHYQLNRLRVILEEVSQIENLDGILLVGDIGLDRDRSLPNKFAMRTAQIESIQTVVGLIKAKVSCPVYYVPGNHDPAGIMLPENVDRTSKNLNGLEIFGIGGAPGDFGFPYEWQDSTLGVSNIPSCDILLTHAPPYGTTIDLYDNGSEHIGSQALRDLALKHKGIAFCGHVHESSGFQILNECFYVNVGALGPPAGHTGYCLATRIVEVNGFSWSVELIDIEDPERNRSIFYLWED